MGLMRPKAADRRKWYQIKNATDDGPPEILIYGEIDSFFGVDAADFVRDMAAIDAPEITVRINSKGGDAFDGVAIGNAIAGHPAHVTGIVDSIAASIASVIAVKCDTLVMNENSQLMVHNAWAITVGDASDMAKTADMLGRQNNNIASIYAAKAGGTVEDWLAVMDDETWMTADEAVQAGLADRVMADDVSSLVMGAVNASALDLSEFRYPGREAAPAPRIARATQSPPPDEVEVTQGKEPDVATLSESLVEKLGLDAEADDAAILEAFEAKLAEKPEPEAEPAPEPTVEQLTQVAAKYGAVVMDRSVVDQLTAEARLGADARAQQVAESDDRTIDDALKSGRITPASANTWRASLKENRDQTKALLATIPANSAVPVHEIGHGVDNEDSQLETEMAAAFNKVTGRAYGKEA